MTEEEFRAALETFKETYPGVFEWMEEKSGKMPPTADLTNEQRALMLLVMEDSAPAIKTAMEP